ncbi:hypothetical protein M5K25_023409 [Dendrobium thyrsiflorum]|uniref:Uncharacterized protein n=1 Tax=Dendrobium thyrsiflorum TaxID=117978 RepID=A0ABD0U822_DENTH
MSPNQGPKALLEGDLLLQVQGDIYSYYRITRMKTIRDLQAGKRATISGVVDLRAAASFVTGGDSNPLYIGIWDKTEDETSQLRPMGWISLANLSGHITHSPLDS